MGDKVPGLGVEAVWVGNSCVNGVNMTNRPVIMDKEARNK